MGGCVISRYHTDKADELLEDFATAVSDFDPNTVGRAESQMIRVELNKLADRLRHAESEVHRELGSTEELQQTYHRYLYAAHVLQEELDETDGGNRGRDLEASLTKLIDELEQLKPKLEQTQQEDHQAQIWTIRLRASFEMLTEKLKLLRTESSDKTSWIKSVKGIGNPLEGGKLTTALAAISVALESMNRDVARARAEIDAPEQRFHMLDSDRLNDDPHIAAALGEYPPTAVVDSLALRERLARLDDPTSTPSVSAA